MSEQQKPGTPGQSQAVPATPATEDATTLKLLVQLMLAERQEQMLEREAKKEAHKRKEQQRRENAEYNLKEAKDKQAICTHRKGGRGLKGPKVDYAVSFHTFVNSESYIRCLICGMKWKNTDTSEHIIRAGKKVDNHTGIGWREAYRMVTESSNTATSSEVKLVATPEAAPKADFVKNPYAVEI